MMESVGEPSDGQLRDLYRYEQLLGRYPRLGDSVPDASLLVVAEALGCVGRLEDAFQFLSEHVVPRLRKSKHSDWTEALCLLGRIGLEIGKESAALKAFQQARCNEPEDWEPHFFLGEIALRAGKASTACRHYLMAFDRDGLHVSSTHVQAEGYIGKDSDEFIRLYRKAREIQDIVEIILVDHGVKRRLYGHQLLDHTERMTALLAQLETRWPDDASLASFVEGIRKDLT